MCRTTVCDSFVNNVFSHDLRKIPQTQIQNPGVWLFTSQEGIACGESLEVKFCPDPNLAKCQFMDLQSLQIGQLK